MLFSITQLHLNSRLRCMLTRQIFTANMAKYEVYEVVKY